MSTPDEIRAKIRHLEQEPDGRLKKLRLNGLRVLLARYERMMREGTE